MPNVPSISFAMAESSVSDGLWTAAREPFWILTDGEEKNYCRDRTGNLRHASDCYCMPPAHHSAPFCPTIYRWLKQAKVSCTIAAAGFGHRLSPASQGTAENRISGGTWLKKLS